MTAPASLIFADRILPDVKPQECKAYDPIDRVERVGYPGFTGL
jgi:hypothetical protein